MKKAFKKLFAFTLAVVMAFGAAPILGIDFSTQASAETEGIYTYSVTDSKATITDCSNSASGAITVPSTLGGYPVTSIGNSAFAFCDSLTSINIPAGVTNIGIWAFNECTSLANINIPGGVTSVGEYTFYDCFNLTSINIPKSVTSIDDSAFEACFSLTSITFEEGSQLTNIGDSAFDYCLSLTSINIPASVTSIGEKAFYHCESLKNINMPEFLTSIGVEAFSCCTSLTSINIPKGVTSLDSTFSSCINLESVSFDEGSQLTSIGDCAFSNVSLTKIIIPVGVTSIGDWAFHHSIYLRYVHIPSSVAEIGKEALEGTTAYICSDTADCYAKKYADENDIRFKACSGHDDSNFIIFIEKIFKPIIRLFAIIRMLLKY